MIYIDENTERISIPKHTESPVTSFILVLRPCMAKSNNFIIEINKTSQDLFFYNVEISKTDIPAGEYVYSLEDEDKNVFETGLLTFGNYQADSKAYNKKENDIIYERK